MAKAVFTRKIGSPPDYPIPIATPPDSARRLLNADRRLRVPADTRFCPALAYLAWHRQRVLEG
jgi:hypothetical protein